MLIIVTVAGFDEGKTGKGSAGEIGEEGGQRGDVLRIDAEGVCGVSNYIGWLRDARTGRSRRVLI
jgi:hypothetical protein